MTKAIIVLIAALAAAAAVTAQTPAPKILFVGNSLTYYNDGVWTHLERMAASGTPPVPLTTGKSVFGGQYFKSLWARTEPREAINTGDYDVVVLQEDLPETTVEDFREYARLFVAETRKAGARPVLMMAWAYDRLGWISMDAIARAHQEAAAELKVDVAPVGLAWQRSVELRRDLNLFAKDREHPNIYGTYLETAVVFATVLNRNPADFPYAPDGVSEADAAFLRRVAWDAVQAFKQR